MEVVKSWALSVAAAAAITAVIGFLSPSGSLDKPVKTITALFMILCFLVPFTKTDFKEIFTDDVKEVSEWVEDNKLKKHVENEVLSMLESSAKSRISAFLKSNGTENSKIDIKLIIDENQNITIKNISITLFEKTDVNGLVNFVKSEFDILPEITDCSEG